MGSSRKKKKSSQRKAKSQAGKKATPKRREQSGGRKQARANKDDAADTSGSGKSKRGKSKSKRKTSTFTNSKTGYGGKPETGARRRRKPTSAPAPREDGRIRLARFLASTGLDSRRKCEEFITTGRVEVDGKVVSNVGSTIDPFKQKIRVDGELIRSEPKRYFVLNKPKGFLCTNNDPKGRRRAVDLVSAQNLRLFTVGRLDENSEGLILVTNDGEMANMLAHPRYEVSRTYRVQVAGIPKKETIDQLVEGIHFSHGFFKVRGVRRMKTQGKSSFLEIELTEGRNREIRRLFARVGHKVINLTRISFGPLKLGRLVSGKSRILRGVELQALQEFVASGGNAVEKRGSQKKKTGQKKNGRKKSSSGSDKNPTSTRPSTKRPSTKAARSNTRTAPDNDARQVTKKKGAAVKKQTVSKAKKPRGKKKQQQFAEKPKRRRITLE
ncbi:UNVERIFIED_CONTAM: hypothetical protein GTU68_062409 [Idotea baltica]|nr:hypothetical protein [Idotea baltica]